jgi:hypothetical protein
MARHFRRRWMLVNRRLQLRIALYFVLVAAGALGLEAWLVHREVAALADEPTISTAALLEAWPGVLARRAAQALLLALPVLVGVAIAVSFRVAGPMYRFEKFLREVRDEGRTAPCTLRQQDDFQEFCTLLNDALAMRGGSVGVRPETNVRIGSEHR